MTEVVTPGSAELLALAQQLLDLPLHDDVHVDVLERASAALRLAAKPDEDGVREATVEECAAIAKAHKGAAARARRAKGKVLHMGTEAYDEIVAEERGEDIASEIIEREILALSTTGKPKPTREGVCSACGGHGVVRVPVAGGPHMSIAERENHDSEADE